MIYLLCFLNFIVFDFFVCFYMNRRFILVLMFYVRFIEFKRYLFKGIFFLLRSEESIDN